MVRALALVKDEYSLLKTFRNREPVEADAIKSQDIYEAEKNLGVRFPKALRSLYQHLGGADDLMRTHNILRRLSELSVENGFLLFMDENQSVVSWGISIDDSENPNPEIWQRINGEMPEWHSEELTLLPFLESMFNWYKENDL